MLKSLFRASCLVIMLLLLLPGAGRAMAPEPFNQAQSAVTPAATPAAAPAPVYDYAILIDTSGSMVGQGDGAGRPPIFGAVQTAVTNFISELRGPSTVAILPFDQGVQDIGLFSLAAGQRSQAVAYVLNLQATGQVTYLYEAISQGLDELAKLRAGDTRPHVQTLLIYTDGLGNGPDDMSLSDLLTRIDAARADQPWLFVKYISLGLPVPDRTQLEAHKVDLVEQPGGTVSPIAEVRITPATLDLGLLPPGGAVTVPIAATPSGTVAGDRSLTLTVEAEGLPAGERLTVSPRTLPVGVAPTALTFRLAGTADLAPGAYTATLRVVASQDDLLPVPQSVPVTFTIAAPTPTPAPTMTPTPTPSPTPTETPSPTPTPTPQPTATPTPAPTRTPTPLPTSTPTPLPTLTPTPPPTPTPTIGIAVPRGPIQLGRIRVSTQDTRAGDAILTHRVDGLITTSSPDVRVALTLQPGADTPLPLTVPDQLGFTGGDGSRPQPAATLAPGGGPVSITVRLDRSRIRALGTGDHRFTATLVVDPGVAVAGVTGGQRLEDGRIAIPVTFTVEVYRPFDPWPWLGGLLALAALALGWRLLPRLPRDAALVTPFGETNLRDIEARSLAGRFLGRPVTLGGPDDDVDAGLGEPAGTVRGRAFRFGGAIFRPSREGTALNGQELASGARVRLRRGDRLDLDGTEFHYGSGASGFDPSTPIEEQNGSRGFAWPWSRRPAETDEFDDLFE